MNLLFLTLLEMEDLEERNIYTDLINELSERGVKVYVVTPRQRRKHLSTEIASVGNVSLLKVKTGNITATRSLLEKGISTILLEFQYIQAIKRYFKDVSFDLILCSTPPITFSNIIKYYKTNQNSKTYLMLKDIFPQNAVDIGIIKKGSIIWRYFRSKEMELYKNADKIGCMSKGNVEYVLKHNEYIEQNKIEVFPNAIKPMPRVNILQKNKDVLKKYRIPQDSVLFIYGGNLGKPQGIDFLLEVIENFNKVKKGHLLIVGNGTEYKRIEERIKNRFVNEVSLLERMPKEEYDMILNSADVGLIFLDRRFTIPNFPSRLTSYMEYALPILAATDSNTDIKDSLRESQSGFWCESGDLTSFINYANMLASDNSLRVKMGLNGRSYLEENYNISKTIDVLLKHLNRR